MGRDDVQIEVYDKHLSRKGVIGDPEGYSLTPRFNAQGTGELYVKPTDRMIPHLLTKGCRVKVTYEGRHLIGGPVWGPSGGLDQFARLTIPFKDDWRLMDTPAYPAPLQSVQATSLTDPAQSPVSGATQAGTTKGHGAYYAWPGATSRERAIKTIIVANLRDRLGIAIDAGPQQDRGGAPSVLPQVRMDALSEAVAPLLAEAGLGLVFWNEYGNERLQFDLYEPRVRPWVLTPESGTIASGSWSMNAPEATRAIVGGPGELPARVFRAVIDAAREADYGLKLERFKDSTGGTLEWPDGLDELLRVAKYYLLRGDVSAQAKNDLIAQLDLAGAKLIAEGAPTSSLSVELAEVGAFRFGAKGFWLGDPVTVRAYGQDFADRIKAVTMTLDSSGEFTVKPQVGNREDDPTVRTMRALGAMQATQRRLATSR